MELEYAAIRMLYLIAGDPQTEAVEYASDDPLWTFESRCLHYALGRSVSYSEFDLATTLVR